MYMNDVHRLGRPFFFLFLLSAVIGCQTGDPVPPPPASNHSGDIPEAHAVSKGGHTSDGIPSPAERAPATSSNLVSSHREAPAITKSFIRSVHRPDDGISQKEYLKSLHNEYHNLDGRKELLEPEDVQSTDPMQVKGEQKQEKQQDQQVPQ